MLMAAIKPPCQEAVAMTPPMIGGVTHGAITVHAGIKPDAVAKYAIVMQTIGATMYGTNKIGFKTIGKPKVNGSLMLNKPGAKDKLETVI